MIFYAEEKEINWLKKFKELEEKYYPTSKRLKYLFRNVKDGNLSAVVALLFRICHDDP